MVVIESKEFRGLINAYQKRPEDYEERVYELLFQLAEYVYHHRSYHFECPEDTKYHMLCEIAERTMSRIKWLREGQKNLTNFFITLIGCHLRQHHRRLRNAQLRQG